MGCKHKWEKTSETTLPSAYEQMRASGQGLERVSGPGTPVLYRKKYICILKCSLCGKLDKTVEVNP